MKLRLCPVLLLSYLLLSGVPAQAAGPGPSLDALNAVALGFHPDCMVSEGRLLRNNDGRLLYKVEIRSAEGLRHEMVLDATSSTMLWQEPRGMHSTATLPLGWHPGDELPSFDQQVAVARQLYPAYRVMQITLRRVGDGRLLARMTLHADDGNKRELMINSADGAVISDREA